MQIQISPTAIVSELAFLETGVVVWHHSQIREGVYLGKNSIIGKGVYLGAGVKLGENCKIQNGVLIYEPAILGDGVFIGPGAILTNDKFPRAINPDLSLKTSDDWTLVGVHVGIGASIGAGSVCVAPIRIGDWSMIGAGSVVTKDVPDFALMVGTPARQVGWVGKSGVKLVKHLDNLYKCPLTGEEYMLNDNLILGVRE
jgi:acetyltransferase-like isoleucine patch superfamily enzyme